MTLVATVAATGADVAALEFTGLNGDVDGIYHIEYSIKMALSDPVVIRFNDDTINAKDRRHTVNSAAATGTSLRIAEGILSDVTEGRAVINAPKTLGGVAKNRLCRVDAVWFDSATSDFWARLYVGEWANSVDSITKISIVSFTGVNSIAEGSWARLYKYPVI